MLESSSLALLRRSRATKALSRGRPSPLTFDTANTGVMRSEAMLSAAASTCFASRSAGAHRPRDYDVGFSQRVNCCLCLYACFSPPGHRKYSRYYRSANFFLLFSTQERYTGAVCMLCELRMYVPGTSKHIRVYTINI